MFQQRLSISIRVVLNTYRVKIFSIKWNKLRILLVFGDFKPTDDNIRVDINWWLYWLTLVVLKTFRVFLSSITLLILPSSFFAFFLFILFILKLHPLITLIPSFNCLWKYLFIFQKFKQHLQHSINFFQMVRFLSFFGRKQFNDFKPQVSYVISLLMVI